MRKKIQLIGKIFTRLTVISSYPKKENGQTQWVCKCSCGKELVVTTSDLNSNGVQSCGCLNRENVIKRNTIHGYSKRNHKHPLYDTWAGMNARCSNKNHIAYKYYGQRGISVCDEWKKTPVKFIKWAKANGWKKGLTIDRKNNEKNYSPENCKISNMHEQLQNTRRTKQIEFNKKTLSLTDWSKQTKINRNTLYSRIFKHNWPIDKALTIPTRAIKNKEVI